MARVLGALDRIKKVWTMSPDEVLHRLRYRSRLAEERKAHREHRLSDPHRLRATVNASAGSDWAVRALEARRERATFFPSVHEQAAMRELFGHRFAAEAAASRQAAREARAHRFTFFGQQFDFGAEIPWQSDPVTSSAWPAVYHADVPVHGGNVGFGDVKHVWELSRQQYLVDLGKSWFLYGEADDLAAVQSLVRSWVAGNPYATGVNWACALEPAFRVFSWLWAYHMTRDALDDSFHLEWLEAFYDHGRFLEGHLELYASPFNHLMAEAAALYMLGCCFDEWRDAEAWRQKGRRVLETRLREQFYADGGSVEQSTFYHHATVGFLLLAALISDARGERLNAAVWDAIERGIDFSLKLAQPDGFTPTIGGADDGKPIRMEHLPLWDFRAYQAIGAVVFGRSDFKAAAGRFYEDALWLTGPAGLRAFDALPATNPAVASSALPASGYYVLRGGSRHEQDYVCIDIGEQAAGIRTDAIPNSMHGHADCLSIIVWLAGRRTLVDSGFFAYNAGGTWEAHFRETAAHNTARVDGRDQARHIGKMAWSHSYRARVEAANLDGAAPWVSGSHDGYARGADGVVHRRTVWLRPEHVVVVLDTFEGRGDHDLEVNFQFAPGALRLADPGSAEFDGRVEMTWVGDAAWIATTACGGASPADGWIAPSLGVKVAAPRLILRRRATVSRNHLLTVLAVRRADGTRVAADAEMLHGLLGDLAQSDGKRS